MHDWMASLVAALEGQIIYVDNALILYRQHNNNELGAKKERSLVQKAQKNLHIKKRVCETKYFISRTRKIAGDLLNLSKLTTESYTFLKQLNSIEDNSKVGRIKFYLENDLLIGREGLSLNKLLQLICL